MAEHVTRCPHCQTSFRLRDQHLDAAGGKVRCGSCLQIFNAKEHLLAAGSKPRAPRNSQSQPESQNTQAKQHSGQALKTPVKKPLAKEQASARTHEQRPVQGQKPVQNPRPSQAEKHAKTQVTSQTPPQPSQGRLDKTSRAPTPNQRSASATSSAVAQLTPSPAQPKAERPGDSDDLSALQEVPADDLFDSVFDGAAITDSEADSGSTGEESFDDYLDNSDSFEDLELSFEELLRGSAENDTLAAKENTAQKQPQPPEEDLVFHDDMDSDDAPLFDDAPDDDLDDDLDDDPFKDFGTSLPTGGNRLNPTEELELDIDESLLDMPGIESKPIGKLEDDEDSDDEAWARALLEDDSDIPESISKELNLDQEVRTKPADSKTKAAPRETVAPASNRPLTPKTDLDDAIDDGKTPPGPGPASKRADTKEATRGSAPTNPTTAVRRSVTNQRTENKSSPEAGSSKDESVSKAASGRSQVARKTSHPRSSGSSVSSNPFDDLTASLLGTSPAEESVASPDPTTDAQKGATGSTPESKSSLAFALADDDPDSSYSDSGTNRLAELTEGIEVDPLSLESNAAEKTLALGWLAGALVMMLLMVAQFAYFQFSELSREQAYRPYYASLCAFIGCRLPSVQNVNQMAARNLIVRTHPTADKALVVDALIINHASFEQPFPDLLLVFKDINGKGLASRQFKPSEYLAGEMTGASTIPSGIPVHIALEIRSPGMVTIGHEIRLLANQW
jgi:predicted Zn finger-like uncharacterized protein